MLLLAFYIEINIKAEIEPFLKPVSLRVRDKGGRLLSFSGSFLSAGPYCRTVIGTADPVVVPLLMLVGFALCQVMEYWESDIVPDIRAGKRVIMVAHANTLRSLVKR